MELSNVIKDTLRSIAQHKPSYGDLEYQTVFDDAQQRYQVLVIGWLEQRYHCQVIVHVEINQSLVWLQQDLTDANVAELLIEHGISRDRIVLGFQAPYKRGDHGFATGL
jgi:XisI protein